MLLLPLAQMGHLAQQKRATSASRLRNQLGPPGTTKESHSITTEKPAWATWHNKRATASRLREKPTPPAPLRKFNFVGFRPSRGGSTFRCTNQTDEDRPRSSLTKK
eukprot:152793-Prorocentrum_minimum.AAC.2